jgi:shikimate dehydrogenase
MKLLGLIGYPLSHSFSKKYFTEKFEASHIADQWQYELFPIKNIKFLTEILARHPELVGLNVTIPYKEQVVPFLNYLDADAEKIGAVNCIAIENGKLKGFNTDVIGFGVSLQAFIGDEKNLGALILGTGGAAKGVEFVLRQHQIPFLYVSRNRTKNYLTYDDLTPEVMQKYRLIINTTPLGMSPHTETFPPILYQHLSAYHFLYDLVYNPIETLFLKRGAQYGAKVKNGLDMLHIQAEAGWKIWNH